MYSGYFSLFFTVVSLFLTDIQLPIPPISVSLATLSKPSISKLRISGLQGIVNSSHVFFQLAGKTEVDANANIDVFFLGRYKLFVNVFIDSAEVIFHSKRVDGNCSGGPCKEFRLAKCDINLVVSNTTLIPKSDIVARYTKPKDVEDMLKGMVCKNDSFLIKVLGEKTFIPPLPSPNLSSDATPVNKSLLIRTAVNVLNNFPGVYGVRTTASLLTGTTLHVDVEFSKGIVISHNDFIGKGGILSKLGHLTKLFFPEKLTEKPSGGKVAKLQGNAINIPSFVALGALNTSSFRASFDVVFNDMRCEDDGLRCTLPKVGGIKLQNIRVDNLDGWSRVFTNHIGSFVASMLNNVIQKATGNWKTKASRVYIPQMEPVKSRAVPPTAVIICMALGSVIILVGTVFFSIWKHRRVTVLVADGSPLSLKRALLEDVIFMIAVIISANGFLWSNLTSASVLYIGNELSFFDVNLYSSLKNTYEGGALVFAAFIFFFSCFYPYIKLAVMVVCTLVLHKPDLTILKFVDFFGKFSFIDVYAMLIMNAGVQIKGVMHLRPMFGFYIFVLSTVFSIILGNYAVNFWRRNTSLRQNFGAQKSGSGPSSADDNKLEKENKLEKTLWEKILNKLLVVRLLHTVITIACVIPIWVSPSVRYTVTEAASLLLPDAREVTMWELASFDWFSLLICLLTVVVTPLVYAVLYPWHFLPATWAAVDVLAFTAFVGVTQLTMFVRQSLGKKAALIYGVKAQLLWPMYLLLIYSVCHWVLVADQIFLIRQRIKDCLRKGREKQASVLQQDREEGWG